jgi:DNA-binding response OmpR family regulator
MQATIVVVDDEEHLREAVVEYLGAVGFRALPASGGQELRAHVAAETVDLVLLDIAMPGEDGLTLARWLRGRGPRPGIIMATAAGAPVDRIVGLEIGADDYLVKPYDLREMLARVRSVLRRLPAPKAPVGAPAGDSRPMRTVRIGTNILNLDNRTVVDEQGASLDLTSMEVDLLAALATRPNRVLSRSQLLEYAHGRGDADSDRSVDIRVTRLRKKIEKDAERPVLIRTVRGEGYVFVPGDG